MTRYVWADPGRSAVRVIHANGDVGFFDEGTPEYNEIVDTNPIGEVEQLASEDGGRPSPREAAVLEMTDFRINLFVAGLITEDEVDAWNARTALPKDAATAVAAISKASDRVKAKTRLFEGRTVHRSDPLIEQVISAYATRMGYPVAVCEDLMDGVFGIET